MNIKKLIYMDSSNLLSNRHDSFQTGYAYNEADRQFQSFLREQELLHEYGYTQVWKVELEESGFEYFDEVKIIDKVEDMATGNWDKVQSLHMGYLFSVLF